MAFETRFPSVFSDARCHVSQLQTGMILNSEWTVFSFSSREQDWVENITSMLTLPNYDCSNLQFRLQYCVCAKSLLVRIRMTKHTVTVCFLFLMIKKHTVIVCFFILILTKSEFAQPCQ